MSRPAITNADLASALITEAETREGYSASALLNSARIIATFPFPITDASQLKGVKGIGDGTRKRVASILSEGLVNYSPPTPSKPDVEVTSHVADPDNAFDFTTIKFFGKVTNRNLHTHGIITLEALELKVVETLEFYDERGLSAEDGVVLADGVSLTANQLAGLRYREHLAERIPRDEVTAIGAEVLKVAETLGMRGEIAGSYRRGKADSGDVDVLLTGEKNRLSPLITTLWNLGLIRYTFSLGEVKYMGVAVTPTSLPEPNDQVRRRSLDIRYVPPDKFGTSLLFATGPDTFNVQQRQVAIDLGLKLSEYGLTDHEGKRLPASTEAEVFEALGMEYLTPQERESYATTVGVPRK